MGKMVGGQWMAGRRTGWIVAVALCAGLWPLVSEGAAAGSIAGQFSVSRKGEPQYVMPLPTPGGAGGLSPNLTLQYVGGSGLGLAGWDITVGGLSKITRCPQTQANDKSNTPVELDSSDRFCLDGQELLLKDSSSTYGGDGVTYDTSATAKSEVISYTGSSGSGPQYFTVLRANGTVWQYGKQFSSEVTATNTSGETVGRVWYLDQIKDPEGNTVTFHYTQPSGSGVSQLSEVEWGSNSSEGTTADHSLVFTYKTVGTDATQYSYTIGNESIRNQRLSKVSLEYGGSALLTWSLSYLADGSGSNRSRLSTITECDAGGACYAPTTFSWQQGTTGYQSASDSGQSGPSNGLDFVADINGDGRQDLVYDCGGDWCVRFGQSGGGLGSAYDTGVAATTGQPIHLKPGPAEQILVTKDYSGTYYWAVISWNGSGFTVTDTGIPALAAGDGLAIDLTGNGLDDLVVSGGSPAGSELLAYMNTDGSLSTTGTGVYGFPDTLTTTGTEYLFDGFVDVGSNGSRGEGRAMHFTRGVDGALVRESVTTGTCTVSSSGTKTCSTSTTYRDQALTWNGSALVNYGSGMFAGNSSDAAPNFHDPLPLDIDGDGLTDIFNPDTGTLMLNTGTGFTAVSYGGSTSGWVPSEAVAVDYTGNGRQGVLIADSSTGDWMWLASTGTGLASPVDTGVGSGSFGSHPVVADTGGRMLGDLVGANSSGDFELALRQGPFPDLVTKIVDGFGNDENLTWDPLSDSSLVTDKATPPSGFQALFRGDYVLASWSGNNGVGGTHTVTENYDTPQQEVVGPPGLSGFASMTSSDSATALTSQRKWTFSTANGPQLSSRTVSTGAVDLDSTSYSYNSNGQLSSEDSTQKGTHGTELRQVDQTFTYNSSHLLNSHTTTTTDADGFTNTLAVTFSPTESETSTDWCLDLNNSVSSADTSSSGTQDTRLTDYTPDLTDCRYSGYTLDAGAAASEQTQVALTYDAFDNVNERTVTGNLPSGSPMSSRTTTYTYGSQGEYRISQTDAAGNTTKFTWDAGLGSISSVTAPDGGVTDFSYGGFGRLTKTVLPTGGYITRQYVACSGGCGLAAGAYYVLSTVSTSAGGSAGESYAYYDRYGRLVSTAIERADGAFADTDIDYNAAGEVSSKTVPFFSGNSDYPTTYTYDASGRLLSKDQALSSGSSADTTYSYSGLTKVATLPNGTTETITSDPLGDITAVTKATSSTSVSSSYTYGPFGELATMTGPNGGTTQISYDQAGNRTQMVTPDRGTLSFSPNSLGEVVSEVNAKGQTISMSYGPLGRLTQRSFPGVSSGTETQSWSYKDGLLINETDSATGFSRSFTYNADGEPTSMEDQLNGSILTMDFAYDSLGRRSQVVYPVSSGGSSLTVDYAYGPDGYLDAVTNAASGASYWKPQSGASGNIAPMNAFGQWATFTLGSDLDVERLHDPATDAVTSVTGGPSGSGSVLSQIYQYDSLGDMTSLVDENAGLTRSFGYDGLRRLTAVSRKATSGGTSTTTSSAYSYGPSGRFTEGGPAGSYAYAAETAGSPEDTSLSGVSASYAYNAAGELTQWSATTQDIAPVAEASASPTTLTAVPTTVTLDGSGSYDPDNGPNPLTYQWTELSGPSVSIADATAETTSVTISSNGTYKFELTVSDGVKTSSETVTVTSKLLPGVPAAPTLSPNPSGSGAYTVSWSSLVNVQSYNLDQKPSSGTWLEAYSGSGTSWSASGKSDGTYDYRVQACNSAGCSNWGSSASEQVDLPPGTPAAPSVSPSPSSNGSYTVSWSSVSGASSYHLDQEVSGGSWSEVYSGSATSWSASGKANGTYDYRVQSCDAGGCSSWSSTTSEQVLQPPASAPTLSISPSDVTMGNSYTVSWTTVSTTSEYEWEMDGSTSFSGASPTSVGTSTSMSKTAGTESSSYYLYYRVRACNSAGCSGWSNVASVYIKTATTCGGHLCLSPTTSSGTGGADPTATWDALGQVREIGTSNGTVDLNYAPDGSLVQMTGTDGGEFMGMWLKFNGASSWTARIEVDGHIVAEVKDGGSGVGTQYLVRNALGSTAAVASGTGTLIMRIAYGAWGDFVDSSTGTGGVSATTVATVTTVTYTGHELIAQAGLIDMGARLYDPQTGLFISPDPTVAHPDDSQDLDQYAYVQDNPLSYVDPLGLSSTNTDPYSGAHLPKITVTPCWEFPLSPGCNGGQQEMRDLRAVDTPTRGGWGMRLSPTVGAQGSVGKQNKPATRECTVNGKVTANLNSGKPGALPGINVQPGNVAIDPRVLGLTPGAVTNAVLAEYGPQTTVTFSPPPVLPLGFPTIFTIGDVVGPASARAENPPIFDINGLPNLTAAYNVTEYAKVTISYPQSAPFNCASSGGG